MSGGSELLEIGKWMKGRIETDTSLDAYLDLIPDDVPLPAVRMLAQSTKDINGVSTSTARIMVDIQWLVAIVNPGLGVAPLVPLVNAVDGALHGKEESNATLWVACIRVQPFNLLDVDQTGARYRHTGGVYRTQARLQ